ncbi:hypothetical protein G9A89_010021 [Geosiphon pyriformis]|nr:hypothetical protein G9A89_010021 [Geosiphon pyriformis]
MLMTIQKKSSKVAPPSKLPLRNNSRSSSPGQRPRSILKQKPKTPKPQLVFDILDQIFIFVADAYDDADKFEYGRYQDLFNCLLVNRAWAQAVMPLLWSQPLRKYHLQKNYKVLKVYLSLLDITQRSNLKATGIEFPKTVKPAFEYARYIKHLNYGTLVECIRELCEKRKSKWSTDCFITVLGNILELFSKQGAQLKVLEIYPSTVKQRGIYAPLIGKDFFHVIESINRLEINGNFIGENEIYDSLAETCRNIEHITIRYFSSPSCSWQPPSASVVDIPVFLVQMQNKLVSLTLHNYPGNADRMCAAILSQKNSLRHIILKEIDFEKKVLMFKALAECENLETLTLCSCKNLTAEMAVPLWRAVFANLREVKVIPERDSCMPGGENVKICWEFKTWANIRNKCEQ